MNQVVEAAFSGMRLLRAMGFYAVRGACGYHEYAHIADTRGTAIAVTAMLVAALSIEGLTSGFLGGFESVAWAIAGVLAAPCLFALVKRCTLGPLLLALGCSVAGVLLLSAGVKLMLSLVPESLVRDLWPFAQAAWLYFAVHKLTVRYRYLPNDMKAIGYRPDAC